MSEDSQHSEREIRRLLTEAVHDVAPEGGLDEIFARTEHQPRHSWVVPLAAAAAVAVIVGGAVVVGRGGGPSGATGGGTPTPTAPAGSPSPQPLTGPANPVYFAVQGGRLVRVPLAAAPSAPRLVQLALTRDGTHGLHGKLAVRQVVRTQDAFDVTVEAVGPQNMDLAVDGFPIALQAAVWTLDVAYASDLPVRFLDTDGAPATYLWDTASDGPVTRQSAEQVLGGVQVDLADGAVLSSPATVRGEANAFEANVAWELKQGDRTVRSGFTTARECCTLSPYDFTVEAPPGDYTLVVHDTDPSGGEGIGVTSVERRITLR